MRANNPVSYRNANDERTALALQVGYKQGQDSLRQEIAEMARRVASSHEEGAVSLAGWLQSWTIEK